MMVFDGRATVIMTASGEQYETGTISFGTITPYKNYVSYGPSYSNSVPVYRALHMYTLFCEF